MLRLARSRWRGGGALAEFFKFAERGTNLATEVKAGVTTFMVMAYILFLNPAILSNMFGAPGSPEALAFIPAAAAATALVAGVMTHRDGRHREHAPRPGRRTRDQRRGGVRARPDPGPDPGRRDGRHRPRGLIVTVLVLVGLREAIMRAVPLSLKRAIGVGIGLFILFIGFIDAGIIVKTAGSSAENPVPVTFVFPTEPAHFLFWFGLLLTVALWARKVPAALLISILVTTVIAIVVGDPAAARRPSPRRPDFSTLGDFDLRTSSSCSAASPRS